LWKSVGRYVARQFFQRNGNTAAFNMVVALLKLFELTRAKRAAMCAVREARLLAVFLDHQSMATLNAFQRLADGILTGATGLEFSG
jgi:hypothetical protein